MMRVIAGKRRRDRVPITELRSETKMPSANQLAIQAVLNEAWKIQHGLSDSIKDLMSPIEERNIITRAAAQGHVRVPAGKCSTTSFSHQAAKLWNDAPANIRDEVKHSSAKKRIREFTTKMFP